MMPSLVGSHLACVEALQVVGHVHTLHGHILQVYCQCKPTPTHPPWHCYMGL